MARVTEIYFNSSHPAAEAVLGQFNGLIDIGGFYTADDGYRHVIVGTTNGDVTEIFYKPTTGIFQAALKHYDSGLIALDGFYTSDDNYRHVIVATADGNAHELFFNPQTGSGDGILGNYTGIVDVAGFYTSDDNYRHAIVATGNGSIYEIFYNPSTGSGQTLLSTYIGVLQIGAYFTPTDNYRHVIVGTASGNVYEVFYNPQVGQGNDTLASFQPLPPTLEMVGPDTPTGSVNNFGLACTGGQPIEMAGDAANSYVVTLNAGVWKSVNGGPWAQLTQSPRYAMCMAVNPLDSTRLAAGERDGDAVPLRQNVTGVWESQDGGSTWVRTLDPFAAGCALAAISSIAYSRLGTLFAATSCGIARKAAGGGSFDFAQSPPGVSWVSGLVASESKVWARTPSHTDGTISTWTRVAATREAGGTVDPLHPDIWDFLLAPDASRAWQANDGGVSSKTWPSGGWQTYNQALFTLYLHMLTLLSQKHVEPARIAFPTPDNDAWFYDSGLGWQNLNGLGDANWTAGDQGNPKLALMWRNPGLAVLTGFSDPLPVGTTYQYGIILNNDFSFDGPLFFQFIQTLKNEAAYPLGDAVMLVRLPLQYRSG